MNRPLRALHIVGDSKFGGGDVVIWEGLKILAGKGIDVTLLATDPSAIEYARSQGLSVWPFRGIRRAVRPVRDLWATLRLAWAICGRYDIVHTNTTKAGAVGRTAAYLARVPAILHTVHGFSFHEFSSRMTTTLVAAVERILAMMSDRVIFVNDFDRRRAVRMGILPARKAVTVYNGLGEDRLGPGLAARREELLAELNLPGDAVLSVFVGRLAPQKGLRYLLEALGIIRRTRPDLKLHQVVVGEGQQEEESRRWAKQQGVDDAVHFLGFRPDAVRWTGGADMFVVPSLWEGHSITLLEAMGCGAAIVATNIKGNRESLTHGRDGLLVKPADSQSLAEGMISLAENRDLARRLGQAARQTFLRRFTLQEMLKKTWAVYEELLSSKGML